jgi:TolB-like protein
VPVHSVERKLAAIFAADIAGYSRLMARDEIGTLARLKACRAIIDGLIAAHRGRIFNTAGDSVVADFASAVDAVQCAVAVQAAIATENAGGSADEPMQFRIAVHVGDVMVDGSNLLGDGVNIAARLESLAEPGAICVSAVVRDQVGNKLPQRFDDLGDQQVKNIAQPIRVYRVQTATLVAQPVAAALPLPDKPSIAVLPFQNMSGDPEQEYFVDGMVEEIITALSRIRWLFVIARNSTFTYKGRPVDVKEVGRELGVRYVLEGSVRKGGNRVRITGQLIDTATGAHIWADRFDGALDDVFELQDQIASSVVGAIEPRLRQSEIERASRKPTASLDAYDFYLRALAQFHRYAEEGFAETVALLQQALAIDPSYAPAAALVGWCRMFQGVQGWGALSDADISAAVRLARQALEAERDDAETLARAAFTLFYFAGETAMAMAALDRAMALNSNAATAWVARGTIHALRNQSEPAIEACDRALRLSPFDPLGFFFFSAIAIAHLLAGRFEQAIEWADRGLHDQPRFNPARRCKIAANVQLGRLAEARAELGRLLAIEPGATMARWRANVARSASPEFFDIVAAGLRLAGLPEE